MRKMLRRLLGKSEDAGLDVAQEDWAPIPASGTGSGTDWGAWLQQADALPAARPATPPAPRATPVRLDLASAETQPVLGRARIRTPMPERRWREVLSDLAEHLSDEELRIIRKQLGE
jgi:hypothetical protein